MLEQQESLDAKALIEKLKKFEEMELLLLDMSSQLSVIIRGFPIDKDGRVDADAHRQYHEAAILAAQEQAKFWRELKNDLIKKGVWSVIIIGLGLIATGLYAKFGITHRG